MRLIDADALMEKEYTWLREGDVLYSIPPSHIDLAPTIDAVSVVRCKECVYYHAKTGWCAELSFFQTADGAPCSPDESADWKMFMEDDFCSRGKRAEDNHESV
jgi:hypothetical protein